MSSLTKDILICDIKNHDNLIGEIKHRNSLIGEINGRNKIVGDIAIGVGMFSEPDYYTGSYEITPSSMDQVLPTTDKTFSNDLVIRAIPYTKIKNEYGTTVVIG